MSRRTTMVMIVMTKLTGEVERREAGQRSLGNCCKKTSAERQSAPQVLVITILIRTIMMESIHRDAPPLRHCFVWGYLGFPMQLKNNFLHPVLLGHHHFHHQLFPGCRKINSLSKRCFRLIKIPNKKRIAGWRYSTWSSPMQSSPSSASLSSLLEWLNSGENTKIRLR